MRNPQLSERTAEGDGRLDFPNRDRIEQVIPETVLAVVAGDVSAK